MNSLVPIGTSFIKEVKFEPGERPQMMQPCDEEIVKEPTLNEPHAPDEPSHPVLNLAHFMNKDSIGNEVDRPWSDEERVLVPIDQAESASAASVARSWQLTKACLNDLSNMQIELQEADEKMKEETRALQIFKEDILSKSLKKLEESRKLRAICASSNAEKLAMIKQQQKQDGESTQIAIDDTVKEKQNLLDSIESCKAGAANTEQKMAEEVQKGRQIQSSIQALRR